MQNILITGATGFIGRALCDKLLADGIHIRAAVWREELSGNIQEGLSIVPIDSIGPDTDWAEALAGVDTVIHLAARVHVMDEKAEEPLAAYRRVNVAGTERLARMAAANGVKRLVFISSVKVHGEEAAKSYTEDDPPAPLDPYGISKLEAEEVLKKISGETGLEVVIVRPPLVYGAGVKANFYRLMGIVARGIPLPLASIVNVRSFIYLGNLIDAITVCAAHPRAAGQTFLVSDGEDVSTPELIRRLAGCMGRPARMFPFPAFLIRLAGKLTGKTAAVERLLGSLVVDNGRIRRELGWKPPFTMTEGLRETTDWYKKREERGLMDPG
ncbi:MAG: NAD-dependent dehydratase [Elusimicrobia bacterium GWA2_56_46]|nr:MAG: NAD-dependent dehydratase [Elusimicrobia bacterium GWA2_56_46]OGR55439.1 MAG: NAD-dependent dehydratase [Elusimicrobia bacterium GWC2_56_31]HBW21905.1 NAD-dependent dehydratase [Elusimicrobiota bacterium]